MSAGGFSIGKGKALEEAENWNNIADMLKGHLGKMELALWILRAVTVVVTVACCAIAVREVKKSKKAKTARKEKNVETSSTDIGQVPKDDNVAKGTTT